MARIRDLNLSTRSWIAGLAILTLIIAVTGWHLDRDLPFETLASPGDVLSLLLGVGLATAAAVASALANGRTTSNYLTLAACISGLTIAEYLLDAHEFDWVDPFMALAWIALGICLASPKLVGPISNSARLCFSVGIAIEVVELLRSIVAVIFYGDLPQPASFQWFESESDLLFRTALIVGVVESLYFQAMTATGNGNNRVDDMVTLLISVNKAGVRNQCIALCELLAWPVTETILVSGRGLRKAPIWRQATDLLPGRKEKAANIPRHRQWNRLRIVASGRSTERLVERYRKLYGGDMFAVFIGSPLERTTIFDIAIASNHELQLGEERSGSHYPAAAHTEWMAGTFTRTSIRPAPVQQQDKVVVLVGGLNRAYVVEPERIIRQLRSAVTKDAKLAVIFSRRTSEEVEQRLKDALGGPNVTFVDRADRAGFENAFAQAREFYVTPDSTTMICEACSSNKPVTVFNLVCYNTDTPTARLVNEFIAAGYVSVAGQGRQEGVVPLPPFDAAADGINSRYRLWEDRATAKS